MKYLSSDLIENKSLEILNRCKSLCNPVQVDVIAYRLGLSIDFISLEDVSGVLIIEGEKGFIGVNDSHSSVRQRFTIAHEIGHYIMHKNEEKLFIDKGYSVAFRDVRSSSGIDRGEIQANQFAASLLMPKKLLEECIKENELDMSDDLALHELANKFEVSIQSMAYRLSRLRIF
jgi:Zn-dependent peptidase ImmA (M78 family)